LREALAVEKLDDLQCSIHCLEINTPLHAAQRRGSEASKLRQTALGSYVRPVGDVLVVNLVVDRRRNSFVA
jgi:hypothetical protein